MLAKLVTIALWEASPPVRRAISAWMGSVKGARARSMRSAPMSVRARPATASATPLRRPLSATSAAMPSAMQLP